MKNIQIIDGADNCVYDIFAASDEEFALLFPNQTDIAFAEAIFAAHNQTTLDRETIHAAFNNIWRRRVKKADVQGVHGTLFYELNHKAIYYPTLKDEDAINPDGTRLR
jgi:hypothetical protein